MIRLARRRRPEVPAPPPPPPFLAAPPLPQPQPHDPAERWAGARGSMRWQPAEHPEDWTRCRVAYPGHP